MLVETHDHGDAGAGAHGELGHAVEVGGVFDQHAPGRENLHERRVGPEEHEDFIVLAVRDLDEVRAVRGAAGRGAAHMELVVLVAGGGVLGSFDRGAGLGLELPGEAEDDEDQRRHEQHDLQEVLERDATDDLVQVEHDVP